MIKHRIFYILLGIAALLLTLNVRLFWIQVAATRSWSARDIDLVENSVIQRAKAFMLDTGRGDFYDRQGQPLTGGEIPALTVFPVQERPAASQDEVDHRIVRILHTTEDKWKEFRKGLTAPAVWAEDGMTVELDAQQIAAIRALQIPQFEVTRVKERYAAPQPASQLIGYVGQDPARIVRQYMSEFQQGQMQLTSAIGGAGLEKTFEPWLHGIGATRVALFTDGFKRPLPGLATRVVSPGNEYYPLKIMTTLDLSVQRRVEQAMAALQVKEGAVVVLDTANADAVAIASRPAFHPARVDLESGAWSNRALKAVPPGSIFKTVTAAAALDEKLADPEELFDCNGTLGKYGLTCWKKEGHGRISLRDGYAQSCNIVFAQIAERLQGSSMQAYANQLGLGVPVGWKGDFMQQRDFRAWDAEERGQIFAPTTAIEDGGVKAQSAIGQRDVLVTPLQAANMVVTLLHQGEVLSPRIVHEVRFNNGRLMQSLDERRVSGLPGAVSERTADIMLDWMQDVVQHGTGKVLQSAEWSLAAKSGTAQVTDKHGRPVVHQWFIGYGPVEEPKFAVAVLVQNMPESAPNKAAVLFREVMNILADGS
ncbi:peptidoglycan D,D-transpeptidase FtsI family protein [Paenibacillus xerothermodurans]|uniref:Penicillin-binding protein n=1 Tax=Paenibacillus xerothermodurans TaxID=1977292 RepID=A0A2W1NK98_PAEXE|nr:penicillin-binding transpeptidase domain-containing protein [Paenibacillus xerothermodurans]PZE19483.1 penicillin-binding protein [Paenibacillus xerothermodurans]